MLRVMHHGGLRRTLCHWLLVLCSAQGSVSVKAHGSVDPLRELRSSVLIFLILDCVSYIWIGGCSMLFPFDLLL